MRWAGVSGWPVRGARLLATVRGPCRQSALGDSFPQTEEQPHQEHPHPENAKGERHGGKQLKLLLDQDVSPRLVADLSDATERVGFEPTSPFGRRFSRPVH